MALAIIPGAGTYIMIGFLRVLNRLKVILLTMGLISSGTILWGWLLSDRLGPEGVGLGWLIAQTTAALFLMVWFVIKRRELVPARG
jgi:hypothetical protein